MDGMNLIGKVINERYELLELIGSGGMAAVYKGFDRLMNRNVAFKILKNSLKDDDEIVEKFSAEAKASAGLSHQNIVTIYDVGQYEGLSFIVMECIDGTTLKEYIKEHKPVEWRTACEIAMQIADALAAAHEHGIVHRDIKPHNILINKENVAKVADFGIASAVSSETLVAGGSAMGSVYYISPEQARGGYVDATSDIYSLGVVLYEMLTGALPIDGDNAVSIALKKLETEPINPKVINLDIPQELDAIVMKAIAREQHVRYKSANELIQDLKRLLNPDSMHTVVATRRANQTSEIRKKKNIEKKEENKKKSSFNPIIASVILLVMLAVGTYILMTGGTKEQTVPDLLGKTLVEALEMVEGTEFTIDEGAIVYEESTEVEKGRIISQKPGANQTVKKNNKITLTISSGKVAEKVIVPSVEGKEIESVKDLLVAKNLKYKIVEVEGNEEDLDKVLKQSPKAGDEVNEGKIITLHVCKTVKEKEKVEVPSLKGLTKEQAEKKLTDEGLKLGEVKKEKSEKTKDTVISQSPESGESVEIGSTVDIVISAEDAQTPGGSESEGSGNTTDEVKRKTLTVSFPEGSGENIHVVVKANGKEIHNKTHAKSEGKVDILVESRSDATVEVYMDNVLVVRKIIEF